MQERITRRVLAQTLAAAAAASAQAPQAALPANAEEELAAARAQVRANLDQIAKVKLPIEVEPATRFTA